MSLNYKKARSSIKPEEVDDHSSAHVVYLHKNIEEKTEPTGNGDEVATYYEYDEAKLTRGEYAAYLAGRSE